MWIILNHILKLEHFSKPRTDAVLEVSSDIAKTAQFSIIESRALEVRVKSDALKSKLIFALVASLTSVCTFAAVPKKMNAFTEGERLIYARLIESYRKSQLKDVIQQRTVLEKNYPASVHLDNAYYLTGMLQAQNGQLGEAIHSFNTVTDRFPKSNKRPAALFGLAMSYKRLGLQPLALSVLNQVVKQYPGSPESQRAWMHLEVEKKSSLKR